MNRKLRVTLEVLENVSINYSETKDYIKENIKGWSIQESI